MLDHIAVGPFLEQPAGKSAAPFAVGGRAHIELNEGACFLHIFPGRACFAGLQADDRVAGPERFARLHLEVAGQAVALVEEADDGFPLGHRRAGEGRIAFCGLDRRPFDPYGAALIVCRCVAVTAAGQRQRKQRAEDPGRPADPRQAHDASGLHAS